LLSVQRLNASYGPVQILHDINLSVAAGEIVALVGANAAGKSTLMFSLAGLRTSCSGQISIGDERIETLPAYERVLRGLVLVPERRRLFPFMTVRDNLEMGAYCALARQHRKDTIAQIYSLIPLLEERRMQIAGSLSGGEQQMLAIGRGLMGRPKVLLLDEPTEGLAPHYVGLVFVDREVAGAETHDSDRRAERSSCVADRRPRLCAGKWAVRSARARCRAAREQTIESRLSRSLIK
jgi:branched-chain amino acid transport system ATP-binding protein